MDAKALHRQGIPYSEIARRLGRDWRTVERYVEAGEQPRYHRPAAASMLDPFKRLIDAWLVKSPPLGVKRIHQDLVRNYGFAGSYQTVRRYVEKVRPCPPRWPEERFETAPGHRAQVDWPHEKPLATPSRIELPLYGSTWSSATRATASCASPAPRISSPSGPATARLPLERVLSFR